MKLLNITALGRYRKERGTYHKFYTYRGSMIYITDRDFYHEYEKS